MSLTHRAVVIVALLAAPVADAQKAMRITPAEIDGHLRFLEPWAGDQSQFALREAVELSAAVHRFGTLLANAPDANTWNRDAEFHSPRARVQP